MKNRGLQDILVACSDNLIGMSEAIKSVYPKTEHQLCIGYMTRKSTMPFQNWGSAMSHLIIKFEDRIDLVQL